MTLIALNNDGPTLDRLTDEVCNLYFPRLQINKRGEIVLALSRSPNGLTRGVCVGKTPDSKSTLSIGQLLSDWEVCGELQDYNGEVTVTFRNECRNQAQP